MVPAASSAGTIPLTNRESPPGAGWTTRSATSATPRGASRAARGSPPPPCASSPPIPVARDLARPYLVLPSREQRRVLPGRGARLRAFRVVLRPELPDGIEVLDDDVLLALVQQLACEHEPGPEGVELGRTGSRAGGEEVFAARASVACVLAASSWPASSAATARSPFSDTRVSASCLSAGAFFRALAVRSYHSCRYASACRWTAVLAAGGRRVASRSSVSNSSGTIPAHCRRDGACFWAARRNVSALRGFAPARARK